MNEVRVIALAGVFQAVELVRELANSGQADTVALSATIGSVLKIDADTPAAVFGDLSGVRLGLQTLIRHFDNVQQDFAVMQMLIGVLRLERQFSRRDDFVRIVRNGIATAQRQTDHFGLTHPNVLSGLAEIYTQTLSRLRPRIVVHGNPLHLHNQAVVDQIRALLLAGVRAAVLWHQLKGRQWRLIFDRRAYVMMARGLLARCTLDNG